MGDIFKPSQKILLSSQRRSFDAHINRVALSCFLAQKRGNLGLKGVKEGEMGKI